MRGYKSERIRHSELLTSNSGLNEEWTAELERQWRKETWNFVFILNLLVYYASLIDLYRLFFKLIYILISRMILNAFIFMGGLIEKQAHCL